MQLDKIGVVGAGTMGNGIAQVFAQSGFAVIMVEVGQEQLDRGMATIRKNLTRAAEKGQLPPADVDLVLGRITPSAALEDLSGAGMVVEAAFEEAGVKRDIFQRLDAICPPEAILASNTSSISITQLGSYTARPEKVIGMHFFNPVPRMRLVEVVRGLETSDQTFATVAGLAEALQKTPVAVNDSPGFVSNRVLLPMINEAVFALQEGVANKEDIDTVLKLGANHPMGPLELADFIGLDVCLNILEVLHAGFGDPKYRPCPLLKRMVAAGHLGRKAGRGFYEYPKA